MSEPYLIAHKVRSQPAFDIAIRMICPLCPNEGHGCYECDGLGYWWIVPTSGHRAYIHTAHSLDKVFQLGPSLTERWLWQISQDTNQSWTNLPDHYPDRGTAPRINLIEALGLKSAAPAKIERRL